MATVCLHHSVRDTDQRARPQLLKEEGPEGCHAAGAGGPLGFKDSTRQDGNTSTTTTDEEDIDDAMIMKLYN